MPCSTGSSRCDDVGLLAEEWDPELGRQAGNMPQGFSHWALCDSAAVLARGTGPVIPGQRAPRPATAAMTGAGATR